MPERLRQRLLVGLARHLTAARFEGAASCREVAIANDSGITSRMMQAKIWSVARQPTLSIRLTPSGENRNWPNEPAAVPAPNEMVRQLSGRSLPNEGMIRLNEQPVSPIPMITPDVR